MNVPFFNLAAQNASLKDELLPAVEKVLGGGHYILGSNVAALEQEVAALAGVRFGIGVNSGSDALTLALRVIEVRPGRTIALADLDAHCRTRVAGYKVPRQVRIVEQVLRSPSGKPDYGWARVQAADGRTVSV